jgi:hypothetical protein
VLQDVIDNRAAPCRAVGETRDPTAGFVAEREQTYGEAAGMWAPPGGRTAHNANPIIRLR